MEIDNRAIGQRIREEREKLKLSREEFAEIIDLSEYYLGQLERGERQMSLPSLVKISNSLHISLDCLVFGKTELYNYYVHDDRNIYETFDRNRDKELNNLLNKCSPKELALIKKLVQIILPHIKE
ncbi:helix-turn-helix domain-containing protein [Pelotomaculum terephthalicicum JT]|uniref:helix-turn-helix domain-containing protein n=1 Tax=Pelotomaculum TaxID=191373 RepID=UPI0009CE04E1|nr:MULTISPECIES: helix-turn-helix domain-containing protein [Pelotomaculum]MCG9968790.1 helix-turn-helix domain-containing protein [Pelotomaculum terephthalicicum JT]OPX86082.1 MAG: anaerobic benzoate catabolism transcriptional regulator [Pelotomaculum sp. PtaB.Bin117]OPY63440.1 MAG: anaerobic benzoate catabolism transcriptional regulator [Pelotomaculum sp. PtaU1.Bin065]